MRLPEPRFRLVNPIVGAMLRSPLHMVLSGSVLLMSFRGRRTARSICLPLRYECRDGEFDCFTTDNATWWPNFETPRLVQLVVAGETVPGIATASRVVPGEHLDALRAFLSAHPSDAVYHGVSMQRGVPCETDLQRTTTRSVRIHIVKQH